MKWEYKLLPLDNYYWNNEKNLNELGKHGWELFQIHNGVAYLKRKAL